jgi:hypothetical protein
MKFFQIFKNQTKPWKFQTETKPKNQVKKPDSIFFKLFLQFFLNFLSNQTKPKTNEKNLGFGFLGFVGLFGLKKNLKKNYKNKLKKMESGFLTGFLGFGF